VLITNIWCAQVSGILRYVAVSFGRKLLTFKRVLYGLLDPDDGSTMILRNTGTDLPSDTT
jgi:hypothetical protein